MKDASGSGPRPRRSSTRHRPPDSGQTARRGRACRGPSPARLPPFRRAPRRTASFRPPRAQTIGVHGRVARPRARWLRPCHARHRAGKRRAHPHRASSPSPPGSGRRPTSPDGYPSARAAGRGCVSRPRVWTGPRAWTRRPTAPAPSSRRTGTNRQPTTADPSNGRGVNPPPGPAK